MGKKTGGLKSLVEDGGISAGLVMRECNILYPRHVRDPNTPERPNCETVGNTLSPLFAFHPLAVRRPGSDILVGFQVTPQVRVALYMIYDMTTISDMDLRISESEPLHVHHWFIIKRKQ